MQEIHQPMNSLLATNKRRNQEISIQDKQACLLAWQHSGLNKAEFCRQRRMSTATFYRWMRELDQVESTVSEPAFLPVKVVTTEESTGTNKPLLSSTPEQAVDIWLPNGIHLRVSTGVALSGLTSFIQELNHATITS